MLWAGDINAEFLRASSHTRTVNDILSDLNLVRAWDRFKIDFTHCHEQLGMSYTSILDHFFWNETLDNSVLDAGVIHLPCNKSDHSPIYCVIESEAVENNVSEAVMRKPRPSWKRSNYDEKEQFKELMVNKLSSLDIPLHVTSCKDTKCKDVTHRQDLDKYIIDLLEVVQDAAEASLPTPGTGRANPAKQSIPGWSEAVKPYKDQAYFWHQVWQSCGRPQNSEIHKIMKKTRNKYHYEFKKCRKARERIQKSKLLEACMGNGGDLFSELKKLRQTRSVVATSMDGTSENIEEHFKEKYQKLFNSAEDERELVKVQCQAEVMVDEDSLEDIGKVTPEIIRKAALKLAPGKSDPVFSFSTDCFKHAPDLLFVPHHLELPCSLSCHTDFIACNIGTPNQRQAGPNKYQ